MFLEPVLGFLSRPRRVGSAVFWRDVTVEVKSGSRTPWVWSVTVKFRELVGATFQNS